MPFLQLHFRSSRLEASECLRLPVFAIALASKGQISTDGYPAARSVSDAIQKVFREIEVGAYKRTSRDLAVLSLEPVTVHTGAPNASRLPLRMQLPTKFLPSSEMLFPLEVPVTEGARRTELV